MPGSSRPPREVVLPTPAGPEPAVLVGPSLLGHVYRSSMSGGLYFRLLPREDVSLARRYAISQRQEQPRQPGIAPIVDSGSIQIGPDSYVYVSYEVWASGSSRSLTEILRDADPRTRVALMAKVLQALPEWWQRLAEETLPVPADIVFNEQWPFLLALPAQQWWPRVSSLLDEPSRILYLAPEVVRGDGTVFQRRAVGVFACGALAAQSLFSLDGVSPAGVTLQRAAAATVYDRGRLVSRLPSWVENGEHYRSACEVILAALHPDPRPRGGIQPERLAAALAALANQMDPLQLASELAQQGRFDEALAVIEAAGRSEPSPALYMLGARIQGFEVGRPMPAIEYYERVIACNGGEEPGTAYEQLQMLLHPEIIELVSGDPSEGDKLEIMLWRNFNQLSPDSRKSVVAGVAAFFTARRKPQFAQSLLHPFLWQDDTFTWWDIPMSLSYGEALAADGRLREAAQFLAGVEHSIERIGGFPSGDPRSVAAETIEQYQERLAHLFHRFQLEPA